MGRIVAVAASAAVGVGGLIAFAAPASAHAALLTAAPVCDTATGEYVITWSVANDWAGIVTLAAVSATPTMITNIAAGTVVPPRVGGVNGTITGVQRVPGTATTAKLQLTADWSDGYTGTATKTVPLAATCAPDAPPAPPAPVCVDAAEAAFTHTFDGPAGTATVTMADLPLCAGQSQTFSLVSYATAGDGALRQERFDGTTGVVDDTHPTLSLAVDVPPCTTAVYLVWGAETHDTITTVDPYPTTILGGPTTPGSRSTGPLGTHAGGNTGCSAPAATFTAACDASTTVILANDSAAVLPTTITLTTATGHTATATIEPGDTATLTVPADTGAITVAANNQTIGEFTWTSPTTCVTPEPTETAPTTAPEPTVPKPTVPEPTVPEPTATIQAPEPTTAAPEPSITTEAPEPSPTTEPTITAPKPTPNPVGGGAGDHGKPTSAPSTSAAATTVPATGSAPATATAAPASAPIPATVSAALAVTGQAIWVTATAGFALLLLGALFLLVSRRRPHRTN